MAGIWGQTRNLGDRTLGPVDLTKRWSGGPSQRGAQIWGQTQNFQIWGQTRCSTGVSGMAVSSKTKMAGAISAASSSGCGLNGKGGFHSKSLAE